MVPRLATQHFRRHIRQCAARCGSRFEGLHGPRAFIRRFRSEAPCQAEIQHFDQPFRGNDHVGAFQVPMHNVAAVCMSQCAGHLSAVSHH